jgi:hypothetical protein
MTSATSEIPLQMTTLVINAPMVSAPTIQEKRNINHVGKANKPSFLFLLDPPLSLKITI